MSDEQQAAPEPELAPPTFAAEVDHVVRSYLSSDNAERRAAHLRRAGELGAWAIGLAGAASALWFLYRQDPDWWSGYVAGAAIVVITWPGVQRREPE